MSLFPPKTGLGGFGVELVDIKDCVASNLDLFSNPDNEMALLYGKDVIINPTAAISNTGPYNFHVSGEGQEFTYFPLSRVLGIYSVIRKDKQPMTEIDFYSVCNLAPHSLFDSISVKLNNTIVNDKTHKNYHYNAFLTELLSYNQESKNTHLALHGWLPDTPTESDNTDYTTHTALAERREWVKDSQLVDFSIPLHCGIMNSERLLPPKVEMEVELSRGKDNLVIKTPIVKAYRRTVTKTVKTTETNAAGEQVEKESEVEEEEDVEEDNPESVSEYEIVIHKLQLQVRKVIVHPEVIKAHTEMIRKTPAIYPICKNVVLTHLLHAGTTIETVSNVIRGKLPVQMIIGFVSQQGYHGYTTRNPYHFAHYNLETLYVSVNATAIPQPPFKPDFSRKLVARELRNLYDCLGVYHQNLSIGITKEMFLNNTTLYPIDFTPDKCGAFHAHQDHHGNVDINFAFSEPLPEPVTMICYAVYNNEFVRIDEFGNVSVSD